MHISNGKMVVTESNGTFITVINKTTKQQNNKTTKQQISGITTPNRLHMLDINSFKKLIGGKVNRFFIVIWPPFCEESMMDVDISIGLELVGQEGDIFQLNTCKEDNWTPMISLIKEENTFEWRLFKTRLEEWMGGVIKDTMAYELYDATNDPSFENIVQLEILNIEFLTLSDKFNPFGVKIIFDNDYIILSPCRDGSTIETLVFNRLDNLSNYSSMGNVEPVRLEAAEMVCKCN